MRIGFVSTYPPIECGIATYTAELRKALHRLPLESFVISQTGAEGAGVFPVIPPLAGDFAAHVFETSTRLTPDLIHIQHEYGLYGPQRGIAVIDLMLRLRQAAMPVATTLHTVNEEPQPQEQFILRHIVQESSAILVHETFQKETLVRCFGDNHADRIHVLPHGIREMQPIPDAKPKLGLEGKKVILLCGYFRPSKGFHKVIALFPEISRADPDIVLVVAGKTRKIEFDDYRQDLFRQIHASPAVDRIEILRGQFNQHTFDTVLSASDLVLLPYQKGGQSGILAQCFALNRPVVTSDLPAFQEILRCSGGGLVCRQESEYLDNVLRLLNDEVLYRNCQTNIRRFVEQQAGWSLIAGRHFELYQGLIHPSHPKERFVYFAEPEESL